MKGDSYIDNDDVLEHTLQRSGRGLKEGRNVNFMHLSVRYGTCWRTMYMLATDKCFKIKRLQDYKIFNGTKLINNTTWNMSLFRLFSDKHFPVYGQNLQFSPYTGKYVSATSSYVYTRFYIYNISSEYYINVRLQCLDLYISHSTNKNPLRTKRIPKKFFGLSEL